MTIQFADASIPQQVASERPRTASLPLLPLKPGTKTRPNTPQRVARDLKTLVKFVEFYCAAKHSTETRFPMSGMNVEKIAGKPLLLCPECTKLLMHAMVKRTHCARELKPDCKHCPTHCYAPRYRSEIRNVMKFSGMRLLLRGRIDYLWHLFF